MNNLIKKMSVLFTLIFTFVLLQNVSAVKADGVSFSDMEWDEELSLIEEGPFLNESYNGKLLSLSNNRNSIVEHKQGLQVIANTELVYNKSDLDGNFITTWVGVDHESDENTVLKFEIIVDDKLKYESKWMDKETPQEYAVVDISSAKEIVLRVYNKDETTETKQLGDWANIQLHVENPILENDSTIKDYEGMELIFNEEFEGDSLNRNIWDYETTPQNGTHFYANKVGKDENVWVENGNLHLQAKPFEKSSKFDTTSGAITSQNKFSFQYGRIDVRAKIPTEQGMWPAIWMMADNQDYEWPMEGEIDIMELISQRPDTVWSTVHSGLDGQPDYYFNEGSTFTIDEGTFFDDYHVYSLDWSPDSMKFYVDDILITEINEWKNWIIDKETGEIVEREQPAPFNQEFFIKLNLATGGNWAENVDETTRYGERTTMKVDYVRVYQDKIQDYKYSEDNPFVDGKQGPVWYAQKGNSTKYENYEDFDAGLNKWTTSIGNDASFISLNAINSYFNESSKFDRAAVTFKSPHKGYAKVGLSKDVKIDGKGLDPQVDFSITKGNLSEAHETLYENILSNESVENDKRVYVELNPDDTIRFEVLKTRETVEDYDPVIEYVSKQEVEAYNQLSDLVETYSNVDLEMYTSESVNSFIKALEASGKLLDGYGDTESYLEAVNSLKEAYEQLTEYKDDEENAEESEDEGKDDEENAEESEDEGKDDEENAEGSENEGKDDEENAEGSEDLGKNEEGEKGSSEEDNKSDNSQIGSKVNGNEDNEGKELPKTATNNFNILILGMFFVVISGLFVVLQRKFVK